MRASANPTDPGYTPRARHLRVYLDGKRLRNCHTADEEAGEAIVFLSDPRSNLQAKITGRIPEQKLIGFVKIVDTRLFNTHERRQGEREKARRRRQRLDRSNEENQHETQQCP